MGSHGEFYDWGSDNMGVQTRQTCRAWLRDSCRFGARCRWAHFTYPAPSRERQPGIIQESYRVTTDDTRPDTPGRTTQRAQNLRLGSSEETMQRITVAAPNDMSSPLASTPTEEISPLAPRNDFIYIESDTGPKRYLKTECAIIRRAIEENYQNHPSDSYAVLQIASKQLLEEVNICRSVEECWTYWKLRGKNESKIASHWPLDAEGIDGEVKISRRISIGTTPPYANTPVEAMVPGTKATGKPSALWPKEQKELLCEVIKKKQHTQYLVSKEVFWQEVGEDMTAAGYIEGYRMFRDYWDKHGRKEFQYDELPYFDIEVIPETIKQKKPIRRGRPLRHRYGSGQRPPHDEYTPKRAMGKLSLQRGEEGTRARERSLTPESAIKPIRNRKRHAIADQSSPTRPTKKRAPSSPQHKLPKAPVPQTSDFLLHNFYSNYNVKDNTAKIAAEFPLPLIAPATGEVFYPSLTPKETTPPKLPRTAIQPVDHLISHNTPSKRSTTNALAAKQPLQSPAKLSQPPVRKLSSQVSEPLAKKAAKTKKARSTPSPATESVDQTNREPAETISEQVEVKPPPDVDSAPSGVDQNAMGDQNITYYSDEDTIFVEDNTIAVEVIAEPEGSTLVPSVAASTRSRYSETPSLTYDHSITSDEQMVDAPQPSPETSTVAVKASGITEDLIQDDLECTKSKISTMQNDALKFKDENKQIEKKIKAAEQKINKLATTRDVLKESHANNMAEIYRLEVKIEAEEEYKKDTEQYLECYKIKEGKTDGAKEKC
ncbi:hypothetical protein DSL72_005518 [Monilinia vaccinii-corymbosi]|uniref:C3H1-type domain-containing protein n=1 Tax=Monilinia vaccinii-corymbosi TaxID=61207 RepID=A0A8A3PFV1_9HELO|nr:hypothetical protein DSL72_005518 [Monilinia vaccinii-corymbosi]